MDSVRSRIYLCDISHIRRAPVAHRFSYHQPIFCLDLDEIEYLSQEIFLLGTQRWKPFRFLPSDSLLGTEAKDPIELKNSIIRYAQEKGVQEPITRVEYLGNVRTFGYAFSPAAFFMGYGTNDRLLFGVVEVTNTFREKKIFFVPILDDDTGIAIIPKRFYVSPFVSLTTDFHFRIHNPKSQLFIQIDSREESSSRSTDPIVSATLTGEPRALTNGQMIRTLMKYPVLPMAVMLKIHYQAAWLYLKSVPYIRKADHPELQRGGL